MDVVAEEDFEDGSVMPLRANIDSRSVKFNDAADVKQGDDFNVNSSTPLTGSITKQKSILKGSTTNADIVQNTSQSNLKINLQQTQDIPEVVEDDKTPGFTNRNQANYALQRMSDISAADPNNQNSFSDV